MYGIKDRLKGRKKWLLGVTVLGLVWAYYHWRERKKQQHVRKRVFVLFQGAPALGKTTLAGPVAEKLNIDGVRSIAIEQDTFAASGKKSAGKRFTKHLDKLMKDERFDVIISARNNATLEQYQHHLEVAERQGWHCLMMYPAFLDEDSSIARNLFALMILHSMYQRSEAIRRKKEKPHPTLGNASLGRKLHICGCFLVRLRKPVDLPAIPIRWLRRDQLPILDEEIHRNVERFLQHVRETGWRRSSLSGGMICSSLRLKKVNWSVQLRTPLGELIEAVSEAIRKHYKK